MYKKLIVFVCCVLVSNALCEKNTPLISNFLNRSNKCDYLIVTAKEFVNEALVLARHRNNFCSDDVEHAGVVTVEQLYALSDVQDTVSLHARIWTLLGWAYRNWSIPLRYIVLVGDDRIEWDYFQSRPVSRGRVPSFLSGYSIIFTGGNLPDTLFDFSDDFYGDIDKETLLDISFMPTYNAGVAIGRIPCETQKQCSVYVRKVIDYDNEPVVNIGWKNSILLMADDTIHEGGSDPLGILHIKAAETLSSSASIKKYLQSKVYFSQYGFGSDFLFSDAFETFRKKLESGALWTVYFGHGSAGKLSDEGFIKGSDVVRIQNRTRPTNMISLSCSNGSYHVPYNNSMCKQFLFSSGGAITYIGSTFLEYADPSEKFVDIFFRCADTSGGNSIGSIMLETRRQCLKYYPYVKLYHYHLLGDPAIRLSGKFVKNGLKLNLSGSKISIESRMGLFRQGYYQVDIINTDTFTTAGTSYTNDYILYSFDGAFSGQVSIDAPFWEENVVKLKAYVWNDNTESCIDTVINFENNAEIAKKKPERSNPFLITIAYGAINVELPQKSGKNDKLWICNINGRLVAEFQVPFGKKKFSIPLRNLSLSSGTYILTIGSLSKAVLFEKYLH